MFGHSAIKIFRVFCLITAILGIGVLTPTSSADDSLLLERIELANGGTLYGTTKTIEENKFTFYEIVLPDGSMLKLRRNQVDHIIPPPPAAAEYLSRKGTLADTADAHWEMAEWCQTNQLPAQREYHLMQVVRLEPGHVDARRRLEFIAPEGVWIHNDHFYQSHGYVKDDKGKYRMPAAIQLTENKERVEKEISAMTVRIRSIIKQYERKGDTSLLNEMSTIKDPAAVTGLREALADEFKRKQPIEEIQHLIIETIGGIESYSAQNALITIAMLPHEFFPNGSTNANSLRYAREIREQCVRLLKQPHYDHAAAVDSVLPFLRPKPETEVYKVHLAAWIIGEMGDESAIPWLIDGLVTTHKQVLGGAGGNINVGQGDAGGGLSLGDKPKIILVPVQNQYALDALRMMTKKQDIGFDQVAWLKWYIDFRSIGSPNLTRDE